MTNRNAARAEEAAELFADLAARRMQHDANLAMERGYLTAELEERPDAYAERPGFRPIVPRGRACEDLAPYSAEELGEWSSVGLVALIGSTFLEAFSAPAPDYRAIERQAREWLRNLRRALDPGSADLAYASEALSAVVRCAAYASGGGMERTGRAWTYNAWRRSPRPVQTERPARDVERGAWFEARAHDGTSRRVRGVSDDRDRRSIEVVDPQTGEVIRLTPAQARASMRVIARAS